MNHSGDRYPIVGIGASAGGVPAMEGFFKGLPPRPDAAFVVVTHLSPDRESLLHEVLRRYTNLPVTVAEDATVVEPNNVYVMPPNAILTIDDGTLRLRGENPDFRERKPIDIFLGALAKDQGEHAVAVILSGGDGDGTLGAKAVKERGGLTLAQASDGAGPRIPSMPESAIASGVIDLAVPAEQMGAKIVAFARSSDAETSFSGDNGNKEGAGLQRARAEIYRILSSRSGHDFSGYKTKSFVRRVRRRMQLLELESFQAYIEHLDRDRGEVMSLFRDLLINVTNFFRDASAFDALNRLVIPRLFEERETNDAVRVWVPGCSTGEEVYSIAMLMLEHMDNLPNPPRVQIFATDIDDQALTVARAARYPDPLLESVSPERRRRFFMNDGASHVVRTEVRELCIFSPHSLIRDPPFSRMDLVSCRNLLIYFGREVQTRVIPTFHYSLRPGGYLFLGTSENVGQHNELFANLDKKNRVFQAREHHVSVKKLPIPTGGPRAPLIDGAASSRRPKPYVLRQAVEAQVLKRFSPAHVVVNAEGDVIYYSARTGGFLEPAQGAPSRQIVAMARKGIRVSLRAALRQAVSSRTTIHGDVTVDESDEARGQNIRLTIEPLADCGTGEPLFLVLFEPTGPVHRRAKGAPVNREADGTADLERELLDTRETLQSTIEEYETALEELKSSNEELVSANEEAQSTNEELDASKEELQSLNEELNTINSELGGKLEELDRANSDLKNLFESTRIAAVFLDRHLVIRNFTPAASLFFNLRGADIGRPLTELSNRLEYPDLKDHIAAVFRAGEMFEHQLPRDADGKHYLVRLIPYREAGDSIGGVVVTLVDVTSLAQAEEHQKILISELNHRVKNMLAVVVSIANHTLERARTPQEFNTAVIGRLNAMSRAYGLLSQKNWKDASIVDLIQQEMEVFGTERFRTAGPELHLTPRQGLSIGMVIHELATNASKHGALGSPDGAVSIQWAADNENLRLVWKETGGAPVATPPEEGFGLALVRGEIEYRFGGTVETSFRPEGLEVCVSLALNS